MACGQTLLVVRGQALLVVGGQALLVAEGVVDAVCVEELFVVVGGRDVLTGVVCARPARC